MSQTNIPISKQCNTRKKVLKTRKITDGMEIIDRRYLRKDQEMKGIVGEEFEKLQIGLQPFSAGKAANTRTSIRSKKADFNS